MINFLIARPAFVSEALLGAVALNGGFGAGTFTKRQRHACMSTMALLGSGTGEPHSDTTFLHLSHTGHPRPPTRIPPGGSRPPGGTIGHPVTLRRAIDASVGIGDIMLLQKGPKGFNVRRNSGSKHAVRRERSPSSRRR